jgi:hypothetical protein
VIDYTFIAPNFPDLVRWLDPDGQVTLTIQDASRMTEARTFTLYGVQENYMNAQKTEIYNPSEIDFDYIVSMMKNKQDIKLVNGHPDPVQAIYSEYGTR